MLAPLPQMHERLGVDPEELKNSLKGLSSEDKSKAFFIVEELTHRMSRRRLFTFFPDSGPYRRELYAKPLDFFSAGRSHRFRGLFGGNRTGKTTTAAYEVTCHLTGLYPGWWQGHRFDGPISAWACGDSWDRIGSVIQSMLLRKDKGSPEGTGMIPGDLIKKKVLHGAKPGIYRTIYIEHVSGGISVVEFKAYEQKREMFQGEPVDLIWEDEEPKPEQEAECAMRVMSTGEFKGGIVILSFTPLRGMTDVVLKYLPKGKMPDNDDDMDRFVTCIGWDDVPHISDSEKALMLKECEPHLVKARSQGIPSIGSGLLFPVEDDALKVDPFPIPAHWPLAFGLDVGWSRWACVWGAFDRSSDILYLIDEYYVGEATPATHLAAIGARGKWIPGVCDPASKSRSQESGGAIYDSFHDSGFNIVTADNEVEGGMDAGRERGIYGIYRRMTEGRLKIFSTLKYWFDEKALYRRDEKGKIIKKDDHLMDATRYLNNSGSQVAQCYMPSSYKDYTRDTRGGIYQ